MQEKGGRPIWWYSLLSTSYLMAQHNVQICCPNSQIVSKHLLHAFVLYLLPIYTIHGQNIDLILCVCVCAARNQLAFMLVRVCCTHRYSHILSQKWFYNVRCVLCHISTRQAKCNVITRASVIITHSVTVREINGNWANEIYSEEVHTIYLMVH